MRKILLLAFCIAGSAAPAQAADLSTLGCVEAKLDDATRVQIGKDVTRNLGLIGIRGSYSQSVTDAISKAATACTTENSWSPTAARLASLYTLAKLSLPVVQQVATERGMDASALEALFQGLPEETRNKPLGPESYRQLADSAIPDGDGRTREAGALLHTFFEFESILQYASLDFSAA
jgi:hypothetical protein